MSELCEIIRGTIKYVINHFGCPSADMINNKTNEVVNEIIEMETKKIENRMLVYKGERAIYNKDFHTIGQNEGIDAALEELNKLKGK